MGDGWFHSGDAAVVHPDGYAEIRDRLKDVIISGGENISSIEVEGVLLHHPSVQEVAIVGMADDRWGEAPHAFVVLAKDKNTSAEELIEWADLCAERNAYKAEAVARTKAAEQR